MGMVTMWSLYGLDNALVQSENQAGPSFAELAPHCNICFGMVPAWTIARSLWTSGFQDMRSRNETFLFWTIFMLSPIDHPRIINMHGCCFTKCWSWAGPGPGLAGCNISIDWHLPRPCPCRLLIYIEDALLLSCPVFKTSYSFL